MKLIDILVQELPKRDWLPISTLAITQDEDGSVCLWEKEGAFSVDGSWKHPSGAGLLRYLCNENAMEPAEDRANAIVTRDQYEAALAASKAEWNGEGLPPVGLNAEVLFINDDSPKWYSFVVSYIGKDNVIAMVGLEEFPYTKTELSSSAVKFRPLRSEADKKRDEIIEALKEGLGHAHGLYDLMQIYHLINSGKIPHIRID